MVDRIFWNGTVVTMDPKQPIAAAVAVEDGEIVRVGTADHVLALRQAGTEITDLNGAALLPGFIEAHGHPLFSALCWGDPVIDIRAVHTPTYDAALAKIKRRVAKAKPGEYIMAVGLDSTLHEGMKEPSLEELDSIAPDNPLSITVFNFHAAYLNSKAIEACGLGGDLDPALERHIFRDKEGRPQRFTENAFWHARDIFFEKCGKDRAVRELRKWLSKYSAAGYTTAAEIGMFPDWAGYFEAVRKQETLPVRIRVYEAGILDKPYMSTLGSGDDRFRTIGIKFWADGSIFAGTAAVSRPYLNTELTIKRLNLPPDNRGQGTYTVDEQKRLMTAAISQGWQLAVHTQGDTTVDVTLDLYEELFKQYPNANGPCRLEHCTTMRPDQVERAHSLGLVCSFFNPLAYYWGDPMRAGMFGTERGDAILPFGTAARLGMRVSYHCDSPMTWPDPMLCLYFATTRKTQSGKVIGPSEKVDIATALKAITIDAAYHLQIEDLVGSIVEGKRADFVLLDQSPLSADAEYLRNIRVLGTYVDGVRVRNSVSQK
ncbi:amidohydrolase [Bradyrhizobium sp. DOA9]|uniref:amidohydrolase n=1 Tax=Bradyrhizobium sp. DOA9 TaxID=1126627 RepID=UPI000499940D|nr:amidohydrolase [Bradyrhizobium sp. DOA9]GAJ37569.1 exoenzyme regulatory protein aepA precursor [Bradyrhizobium sp. DOA9]